MHDLSDDHSIRYGLAHLMAEVTSMWCPKLELAGLARAVERCCMTAKTAILEPWLDGAHQVYSLGAQVFLTMNWTWCRLAQGRRRCKFQAACSA